MFGIRAVGRLRCAPQLLQASRGVAVPLASSFAPVSTSALAVPSAVHGLCGVVARSFHRSRPAFDDDTMNVYVNNEPVTIPKGATVLAACEEAGIEIPRFCYHDRLSIAGNCRMCLVEVEKSPKPVASCAMPAMPDMKIKTNTPLVAKAREGVMEFLLANHPLDCPICDQGGECDLQDQSIEFGSDRSRFTEIKRTVEDKNLGPYVKTVMTRCIHCTRCVRFAAEVAGVEALGTTGRGNAMEIGTYVEKMFDSELSGNVIDLCPVGALTSKPFAFTARPWELNHTESIDTLDAVGSNIRIDTRGGELMRILPRLHDDVNEEWLSDKSRFAYDGLKRQRLDTPLIKMGGDFVAVSWNKALEVISERMKAAKPSQLKAIAGDQACAESIVALKDLFNGLNSNNTECRQDKANISADLRTNYVFNSTIAGIEDADSILLVGTNPRMEAPIINARIRKSVVNYGTEVGLLGPLADLTYPVEYLGDSADVAAQIFSGKHSFSKQLAAAENAMVVLGMSALRRPDAEHLQAALYEFASKTPSLLRDDWNGINVLQLAAARTGALDLGFVPGPGSNDAEVNFVYLLGADEWADDMVPQNAFVVYQGHHGDKGASRADVILPGCAYTEKDATYVNTEGRAQHTHAAHGRIGDAREDWAIIRALGEYVGVSMGYDDLSSVRSRLAAVSPTFAFLDRVVPADAQLSNFAAGPIGKSGFAPSIDNFFFTDPICRSSKAMARGAKNLPTAANSYVKPENVASVSQLGGNKASQQSQ